ncbi:MAG: MFS transporter [Planctomycetes bacterium]|nr:MFS transporter [Planctomycetota bacterium]
MPSSAERPVLSSRYVWVHVIVAALVMVATLPGRTHGLGVITKPLLRDLQIDSLVYANINLWATLIGALFCLPCGWLLDRFGARYVLMAVMLALGAVVVSMSGMKRGWSVAEVMLPGSGSPTSFAIGLFVMILLTRGLGQSSLSVISLSIIGRSKGRRAGLSYGVYSFALAVGFMLAFAACRKIPEVEWRTLWAAMGWILIGGAFVLPWFLRASVMAEDGKHIPLAERTASATLAMALRTRTFWIFAIATSLYGGIASGISLFNQFILEERGFTRDDYLKIAMISPMVGLASNLATGWLATRWPLGRLLAVSMTVLAASLCYFPSVRTIEEVYAYAVTMGVAGGMVTVLFFSIWSRAFGGGHLGKIQGAAQMLTVLSSALGPVVFEFCKKQYGSYSLLFYALVPICGLLALLAWFTTTREPVEVPSKQD